MSYSHVAIYDTATGAFIGYTIKDPQADKLQTTNIWREGEEQSLNTQMDRLNLSATLKDHWPYPQDPEVTALLDDPTFHPIEYVEREVIDDDNSHYVWTREPEVDEFGNETGRMIDGPNLDREASVIHYKIGRVPARPTDVMLRTKTACEQVARKRAGL